VASPDYSIVASKPGGSPEIPEALASLVAATTQRTPADLGSLLAEISSLEDARSISLSLADSANQLTRDVRSLQEARDGLLAEVAQLGTKSATVDQLAGCIWSLQHTGNSLSVEFAQLRMAHESLSRAFVSANRPFVSKVFQRIARALSGFGSPAAK
jgi:hypothetical protein